VQGVQQFNAGNKSFVTKNTSIMACAIRTYFPVIVEGLTAFSLKHNEQRVDVGKLSRREGSVKD
jgi:hypothetical protein